MRRTSLSRKNASAAAIGISIVLLVLSLALNLFLSIKLSSTSHFSRKNWLGLPRSLSRDKVLLDYQGTIVVDNTNYVDRFVLSNGVNISIYTYGVREKFEQATYLSQAGTIHSPDYLLADGTELSSNLVEIPPGRIYVFDINRRKVEFPWRFQREVLLRNTFDSDFLYYIATPPISTNKLLQDIDLL